MTVPSAWNWRELEPRGPRARLLRRPTWRPPSPLSVIDSPRQADVRPRASSRLSDREAADVTSGECRPGRGKSGLDGPGARYVARRPVAADAALGVGLGKQNVKSCVSGGHWMGVSLRCRYRWCRQPGHVVLPHCKIMNVRHGPPVCGELPGKISGRWGYGCR